MQMLIVVLIGLVAGTFGGFLGLGGGIIMVPALIFLFGMTQHQAQGTVLATMVPPIGLLAALKYYYAGNVNLRMSLFLCLGFFVGGLLGAYGAHLLSGPMLKRVFGIVLLGIALRLILAA
ncbi:MAG: TSUP family transporter [bacterium]